MNEETSERLAQPLAASRIKQRAAGGNRPALSYLETHDVIRTANDIFGFGGWGHEVVDLRLIPPVTVHNSDQKPGVAVGYVCVVRLTVEGCIPTSGIGFGDATEYRESAAVTAHELAAKEAESDALKRALKNFGDQFGLALYDKDAARAGHVAASPAAASAAPTAGGSLPPAVPPLSLQATEPQIKNIRRLLGKLERERDVPQQESLDAISVEFAIEHLTDLTKGQATGLIDRLMSAAGEKEAA